MYVYAFNSSECIGKKSNEQNLPEKIVIESDIKKYVTHLGQQEVAIDQSLNHVSYNTSRIKTVRILIIQGNYVVLWRERNEKKQTL